MIKKRYTSITTFQMVEPLGVESIMESCFSQPQRSFAFEQCMGPTLMIKFSESLSDGSTTVSLCTVKRSTMFNFNTFNYEQQRIPIR